MAKLLAYLQIMESDPSLLQAQPSSTPPSNSMAVVTSKQQHQLSTNQAPDSSSAHSANTASTHCNPQAAHTFRPCLSHQSPHAAVQRDVASPHWGYTAPFSSCRYPTSPSTPLIIAKESFSPYNRPQQQHTAAKGMSDEGAEIPECTSLAALSRAAQADPSWALQASHCSTDTRQPILMSAGVLESQRRHQQHQHTICTGLQQHACSSVTAQDKLLAQTKWAQAAANTDISGSCGRTVHAAEQNQHCGLPGAPLSCSVLLQKWDRQLQMPAATYSDACCSPADSPSKLHSKHTDSFVDATTGNRCAAA